MSMNAITPALVAELEKIKEPGLLLAELHKRFGSRMAIATSGQNTDTALIALSVQAGAKPRAYTADTLRLFPETYAYFDVVEKKYGVKIERLAPDAAELDKMVTAEGEFLFFDSKEKQERCCFVRKVRANERMLDGLDVWVTGLRSAQSQGRTALPRLEIIDHKGRPLLKAQPLVDWTDEHLRSFMRSNDVPMHPLMAKTLPGGWYYESLGCVICTTPIGPNEARRAGRWRWFNATDPSSKECGLHLPRKAE
jgi:phosphoadenosine phosphosulfate reductase